MFADRAFCIASVCLSLGCAPTLSKPRGDAHLALLAEAERDQHHGRLEAAAAAYDKAALAAERRVDRDEALYRESRVFARLGDYERALALCDRLAEAKPESRRTLRAMLDGSRYRLELGQTERAERDLRFLVVHHGDTGEAKSALYALIDLRVRSAHHETGLRYLEQLSSEAKLGFVAEALLYEQAALLLAHGKKSQAQQVLTLQVERFPYPQGLLWDDALWKLADLAEDAGDPQAAVAVLSRMLDAHESAHLVGSYTRPRFSAAALRIARIYRDRIQDLDAAVSAFRTVRDEFPSSLVADDALAEEGELWLARGDKAQGCALLRKLLEEHEVGAARRRASSRVASDCAAADAAR